MAIYSLSYRARDPEQRGKVLPMTTHQTGLRRAEPLMETAAACCAWS
jgi:hypothetical protein